jgi:O-antigen ligase
MAEVKTRYRSLAQSADTLKTLNDSLMRRRTKKSSGMGKARGAATLWFDIKPLEVALCSIVIVLCFALHLTWFYYPLALPIEAGLSLISFATPMSGLLYLSAAQVIPDAPGCPLPSAQMALAGFFIWQLAKGKMMDLFRMGRPLWIAVAPFFVWGAGLALTRGDYRFGALLLFAILTGCAVAVLVRQSGQRFGACLIAFLAGQALAMCLFWIVKLHLGTPVQAFATELYGDSTVEGVRIGTAKGNANMLGPPMALVCIGVIGWFISRPKLSWRAGMIALVCLAAAAPPLIGSGSRGAIMAAAGGVAFLLVVGVLKGRSLARAPVAVAGILVVLVFGWHRLGLDEHWQEMSQRQEQQREEEGSLYAGRTLEWTAAWKSILNSPFVGGGKVEKLSFFGSEELWQSHSTYLDAGLVGGFPGMALFCWLVLKPILELWRRRYEPAIGWLLAVYAVSIISIGSTSAIQSKHFWMLWGMATVCFLPVVARIKTRRNRAARRVESRGQRIEGGGQRSEGGHTSKAEILKAES